MFVAAGQFQARQRALDVTERSPLAEAGAGFIGRSVEIGG